MRKGEKDFDEKRKSDFVDGEYEEDFGEHGGQGWEKFIKCFICMGYERDRYAEQDTVLSDNDKVYNLFNKYPPVCLMLAVKIPAESKRRVFMLRVGVNGFCMALADSVPGVSGGTVAFIMGFYDRFIGSVHDLAFGTSKERKSALMYLAKLGVGWVTGMAVAVVVLSALFESHIYVVSSMFIGFVLGAVPLIVEEEKEALKKTEGGFTFCLIGMAVVIGITWTNGRMGNTVMDLGQFPVRTALQLFFIGMAAISAMFLPGISGSTLLMVFGAYIPVMTAIKGVLSLDFSYVPCLMFFICGIFAGAVTVVKGIRICLEKFRAQTVYVILGMMTGSLYAICMGPTTLEIPQKPVSVDNFSLIAAVVGVVLVFGMQMIREKSETNRNGRKNEA